MVSPTLGDWDRVWPESNPERAHGTGVAHRLVVTQSCLALCKPYGLQHAQLHHLPEFVQTHVHWVGDAIQPSHPLLPSSPFAFSLSQHQGLFQWVSSSYQVANLPKGTLKGKEPGWNPADWSQGPSAASKIVLKKKKNVPSYLLPIPFDYLSRGHVFKGKITARVSQAYLHHLGDSLIVVYKWQDF